MKICRMLYSKQQVLEGTQGDVFNRNVISEENYSNPVFLGLINVDDNEPIVLYRATNNLTKMEQYVLMGFIDNVEDRSYTQMKLYNGMDEDLHYIVGTVGILYDFNVPAVDIYALTYTETCYHESIKETDKKVLECLNDTSKTLEERLQTIQDIYKGMQKIIKRPVQV